ncbi:hypothetical protein ACFL3D_05625 [Candidatus Omnitrophota bacterium]
MENVRIYSTMQSTPLATLRNDIVTHIASMFPSFRSFVQGASLYNDEQEEILFFTNKNHLVYIKIVDCEEPCSLDYIVDDYLAVQERWKRLNDKRNENGATALDVELILISERFTEQFLRRIDVLSIVSLKLFEIQCLKNHIGEVAFSRNEIVRQKKTLLGDVKKVEKIRSAEVVTEETQALTADSEEVKEEYIQKQNETNREEITTKSEEKKDERDFFERAQLSAEEEKEFFLLNQQLAETTENN